MFSVHMWLSVALLHNILPHSKAIESECEDCGCCKDNICETGTVDGRQNIPEYCTNGCKPGYGGNKCHNKCPDGCLTCEQNKFRNCVTCADGKYFVNESYYSKTCEDCPVNCKQCTSKTKCQKCNQPYFNDDTISNCSLSCPRNCICERIGVCSSCKEGHFNVSNTCIETCPKTCANCSNKSHCQSCRPSYSGDMCCIKDGYCKTCASSTFCEICVHGYYGEICNKPCPGECQNMSQDILCERENGVCVSCGVGLYGDYCTLNCSKSCLNNHCHKDTGHCTDGCVEGYQGQNCTEESQDEPCVTIATKTDEVIGIASTVFVVVVILLIAVNIVVVRKWKRKLVQKYKESVNSVSYVNSQVTATVTEQFQYEQLDEVNDKQCEVYEVINSDIK